jgi:hypothetical protein
MNDLVLIFKLELLELSQAVVDNCFYFIRL